MNEQQRFQLQRRRPMFRKSSYRPPSQQLTRHPQSGVSPVQNNVSRWQQIYLRSQQPLQQSSAKPSKQAFIKKKANPVLVCLFIVVLVIVCVAIVTYSSKLRMSTSVDTTLSKAGAQSTVAVQARNVATHTANWKTIQTFIGSGNKKTAVFSVGKDWEITWSCTPASFFYGQYNLIATVYTSKNTPVDLGAIHTICQSGNTSNTTQEHQGGKLYLNIYTEGSWKIQIQVHK